MLLCFLNLFSMLVNYNQINSLKLEIDINQTTFPVFLEVVSVAWKSHVCSAVRNSLSPFTLQEDFYRALILSLSYREILLSRREMENGNALSNAKIIRYIVSVNSKKQIRGVKCTGNSPNSPF